MAELTGTIFKIFDTKQVSETFRTREFVLQTTDQKYPQSILMQVTQDRCEKMDNYKIGETVKVKFNIKGRSWTSPSGEEKFFNSIEAWSFETLSGVAASNQSEPPAIDAEDSLPF